MQSTPIAKSWPVSSEMMVAQEALADELATLSAHLNAATARWLELALEFRRQGGAAGDDLACWLAFRYGISVREGREYVRVAEALEGLPLIRAAFQRGRLTLTKVRALTRVANERTEARLLGLAEALTASQLERALRVYRRLSSTATAETHELEYVDYHWGDDGSLYLRARLAAEDGTVLVQVLDTARERVRERRRAERDRSPTDDAAVGSTRSTTAASSFEPPRSEPVEAFLELAHAAQSALAHSDDRCPEGRARLVVHVDAAALTDDGPGRSELEAGPVIAPETARRLGCDADRVTMIERDGLALSVGRSRRTVPPALRRRLEARDGGSCRWPGCDRRRQLAAHHRRHWAEGGETSLDNLVLLCFQHHRLVHEGGYTIEHGSAAGELRFRNRYGLLCPGVSRPPPGHVGALIEQNVRASLHIDEHTNRHGSGDRLDLDLTIAALHDICR